MRFGWLAIIVAAVGCGGTGCVHSSVNKIPDRFSSSGGGAEPQELPPDQAGALDLVMAEKLERDGKEAGAVAYYERARELSPALNDKASRRLAVIYDRLDQQARAMSEFHALLKNHPKDAALLNDVGYSLYNRGQWSEAETYLRRAVAADKSNRRAWVNLGMTLAQLGKYREGLEAFNKAISPAEAHSNLGFIYASQGKKAEADEEYRTALTLEPRLPVAQAAVNRLEAQTAKQ